MDYRISGERLKGFADQARRLGKVSGELTPGQIEEILKGVIAGNYFISALDWNIVCQTTVTDVIANHIVSVAEFTPGGILEAFPPQELSGAKCYYNGVLLPGIPAEMLARYPYVWIRDNDRTGHYDLYFAQETWYAIDEDSIKHDSSDLAKHYRIEKTMAASATQWVFYENSDFSDWGINSDRQLLWSNHDIPNGSATATEIYFEGSEPVPEA